MSIDGLKIMFSANEVSKKMIIYFQIELKITLFHFSLLLEDFRCLSLKKFNKDILILLNYSYIREVPVT